MGAGPAGVPVTVVDAFTSEPFRGNPAAVCRLPAWRDDGWLQAVAAELCLSETAFVVDRPDGSYDLRWFTPAVEVDLCGHATVAATHVLAPATGVAATFHTRSGPLPCRPGDDGLLWLDFPADRPAPAAMPAAGLAAVLGTDDLYMVARGRFDWLVELGTAATVRSLRPDLQGLAALGGRGVIVTAPGEPGGPVDCVSRCFYPNAGVPEDPVTGSAHCTLASFWSERLGRAELEAEQASARGGRLSLRVEGDRVHLGGRAVTVWEGTLLVWSGRVGRTGRLSR